MAEKITLKLLCVARLSLALLIFIITAYWTIDQEEGNCFDLLFLWLANLSKVAEGDYLFNERVYCQKQTVRQKELSTRCHQWDHINSWNVRRYHWWAWLYKRRHSPEGNTQFNCMNLQVECVLAFVSNYILILRSQNSLYICTKFTFLSLER